MGGHVEPGHLSPDWPVLTAYDQAHLGRIALPLGGIGTGTVSLGGRGDLRDWEIVNRPAKGFIPTVPGLTARGPFFALWAADQTGRSVVRVLEGVLDPPYEGVMGETRPNHGLPRFRECAFYAAYPFGQVVLRDPAMPLLARIEAFNPLIPGDADRSGIPVAFLRLVLINPRAAPVQASVCGSIVNFIGTDGRAGRPQRNRNLYREEGDVRGLWMYSEGVDPDSEAYGTMALVT
ncbi:MAG TPA: GH116 family glycosyl-hydrolase, partial [Limnochordia bacterium]